MKRTYGLPFHASPTELGWLRSVFKSGESLWDGSTFGTVPIVYQKDRILPNKFESTSRTTARIRGSGVATEPRASASGLAQRSTPTPQVDAGQIHRKYTGASSLTDGDLLSAAESAGLDLMITTDTWPPRPLPRQTHPDLHGPQGKLRRALLRVGRDTAKGRISENFECPDIRNATSRNDWRCLNRWSEC